MSPGSVDVALVDFYQFIRPKDVVIAVVVVVAVVNVNNKRRISI